MWAVLPRPQQPDPPQSSPHRPNIVFCMADDWSWPHAGILGDPVVKTPNFDRVAREGVLFENAFVSTPSCTPSRLSILTGQHHWRLKEGDSLGGSLREEFDVYTEIYRTRVIASADSAKAFGPANMSFAVVIRSVKSFVLLTSFSTTESRASHSAIGMADRTRIVPTSWALVRRVAWP